MEQVRAVNGECVITRVPPTRMHTKALPLSIMHSRTYCKRALSSIKNGDSGNLTLDTTCMDTPWVGIATATLAAGCRNCNVICVNSLIVSPASEDSLMRLFSTLMDTIENLTGLDNSWVAPLYRASPPLSKGFPSCIMTFPPLDKCSGSLYN